MALTSVVVTNQVQIPCVGGGFVTHATVVGDVDSVATNDVQPWLDALGNGLPNQGTGTVVAVYSAGNDSDQKDVAGNGIIPVIEFTTPQVLAWRCPFDGTLSSATNVASDAFEFTAHIVVVN
jgi:hypothetical protein